MKVIKFIIIACALMLVSTVADAQTIGATIETETLNAKKPKKTIPVPIVKPYGDNLTTGNCGPRRAPYVIPSPVTVSMSEDMTTLYFDALATKPLTHYEISDVDGFVLMEGYCEFVNRSFALDITSLGCDEYCLEVTINGVLYEAMLYLNN